MITNWKQDLMKRAGRVFAPGSKAPAGRTCAEGDGRCELGWIARLRDTRALTISAEGRAALAKTPSG